jgi:FtsP/CotA-like multicopper oxidase with cupredoxin domain
MRLLRRGGSYILGAVAVLAGAAALTVHTPPAHAAAGAPTQPCIPNPSAPGVLPTLPTIDANVQKTFTLYVMQGATKASGVAYCYALSPSVAQAYVEAPTIHIRQGGTFVMTLRNLIPSPSPNPSTGPTAVPTPQSPIIKTADNCAWLPDDGPLPSPVPGYAGYFDHTRVPPHVDPPWMLANDTNFHTHGFHVSPYVDNVYKSLVWAPNKNSCTFTFTVRASQPPGSYWYHAHLHGLSDAQVGGGLGGVIIVDPPAPAPPVNETVLLIKNYPFSQDGSRKPALLQGGAMAAMDGMDARSPMLGRPAPAAHDASLAARGAAPQSSAAPMPYSAFAPPPWHSGIAYSPTSTYCPPAPTSAAGVSDPMGVNGALIPAIVNGVPMPAMRGPSVNQTINTVHRYSIVSALSDSFVNIETVTDSGERVPLRVVARDGVPVNWNFDTSRVDPSLPSTIVVPNVFVPPSSRVDIDVVVRAGQPLKIISAAGSDAQRSAQNYPYCIGDLGFGTQPQRDILRIVPFVGPVSRGAHMLASAVPVTQQHVTRTAAARLVAEDTPRVTKSRAITFTMYTDPDPNPSASPGSNVTNYNITQTGLYNGANPPPSVQPLPFNERPFWLSASVPLDPYYPYKPWVTVHKNDVEEWTLINATGEIHAFHIHQLTFVALDSPFEATNPYQQVFLDSIALPAGKSIDPPGTKFPRIAPSVTKILIDFRNVDPGVFVFHCHMLFHEDHGMMGVVEVLPPIPGKSGAVHHD